jgi:hypothetical protein
MKLIRMHVEAKSESTSQASSSVGIIDLNKHVTPN